MTTLLLPPGEFQAYLFDCDGTLADTMPLHYRAWRATLDPLGCPFPEELFYALGGTPTDKIVELLNGRNGTALPPVETAVAKEQTFLAMIPQVRPVEATLAVARAAHARGLPLAVASGGFRPVVEQILTALGIREWFGAVVGGDEVARGKPAPDTYLEAARRLGVAPAACLVFEDTRIGLDAAAAAGMTAVFVPSGPAEAAQRPATVAAELDA